MENPFTLLATYTYSAEAYINQGKLEAAGIETSIRDNHIVEANPLYSNAVGGVKLFVRTDQFDEAKGILGAISDVSLTDEGQPLQCPQCGGSVEMMTSLKDSSSKVGFVFALLFGGLPFVKYRYRCNDCNFEFKND